MYNLIFNSTRIGMYFILYKICYHIYIEIGKYYGFQTSVTSVIILAAGARCVADLRTGACELSEQVPHHPRLG